LPSIGYIKSAEDLHFPGKINSFPYNRDLNITSALASHLQKLNQKCKQYTFLFLYKCN